MELTERQERVLRGVAKLERAGGPAFVPDLVRALGLAAESSLTPTLRILERKGAIAVRGGGARGRSRVVVLTPSGRRTAGLGGLPLLGVIPAGPLSEAVAGAEEIVEKLLPWRDGDFLLRVRGDSMRGDGILDGDKVLMRPGVDPRPGEIAAVLVGDAHEATLKHVDPLPESGQVRLRASNPAYPAVVAPVETVRIAGVFRGLIRDAGRTV